MNIDLNKLPKNSDTAALSIRIGDVITGSLLIHDGEDSKTLTVIDKFLTNIEHVFVVRRIKHKGRNIWATDHAYRDVVNGHAKMPKQ